MMACILDQYIARITPFSLLLEQQESYQDRGDQPSLAFPYGGDTPLGLLSADVGIWCVQLLLSPL